MNAKEKNNYFRFDRDKIKEKYFTKIKIHLIYKDRIIISNFRKQ